MSWCGNPDKTEDFRRVVRAENLGHKSRRAAALHQNIRLPVIEITDVGAIAASEVFHEFGFCFLEKGDRARGRRGRAVPPSGPRVDRLGRHR